MHIQKIVVLISVIVGCLSLLLPWFQLPVAGNVDGIKVSYSWVGAALYAICLLPILAGNKLSRISAGDRWIKIAGLSGALYGFFKWYAYKDDIEGMGDGNFVARAISDSVSIQYGLVLFIAAGLLIFLAGSRK